MDYSQASHLDNAALEQMSVRRCRLRERDQGLFETPIPDLVGRTVISSGSFTGTITTIIPWTFPYAETTDYNKCVPSFLLVVLVLNYPYVSDSLQTSVVIYYSEVSISTPTS